ncbi:NAD(P)H-dependent oxidoreductase [Lentilactobacillus laojiaonis]|uniref:NAD(P)H-dependent oxidoreductase n=1 Tax=Lentilactobacillus laojiaonis TaxID=2883998 RepID=UPI001D0AA05B|nr:NAD(P)H-dependent oxidoreductase [Lentilactobacillus laojiaonis]UDM32254.1 NAD(P)H-dependent oxidoreductase [Lentilactobacillus laojiaonis]
MTTLIISSNPNYQDSGLNQFLKTSSQWLGNSIEWLQLDEIYPEAKYTKKQIEQEQSRLQQADKIIFQFPMYWYSAPASLKSYLDQVMTNQFVNIKHSLQNKSLGIVVGIGKNLQSYQAGASENYTISELLRPYQAFALAAQMKYLRPLTINQFSYMNEAEKMKLITSYLNFIDNIIALTFDEKQAWIIKNLKKIYNDDETKKDRLAMIIDQIDLRKAELEELKDNINLIKSQEEN